MESKTYHINNSSVKLIFGDLLDSTADALVISGSVGIPMRGGLPQYVREKAGDGVLVDAAKYPEAKLGDVVVTSAGRLPNKYLFHAVMVTRYNDRVLPNLSCEENPRVYEYIIGHAISKSLRLLPAMELTSIAFPCLGLGMANMPLDAVAKITAKTICQFLRRTNKALTVEIYIRDTYNIYTPFDYLPFFEWLATYSHASTRDAEPDTPPDESPLNFDDIEVKDPTGTDSPAHRVFISYSRKDTEAAKGICGLLNEMKIPYWIDIKGVFSGANFKEVIVNAISASDIVLFLSSASSNMSPNVAKEVSIADKYQKVIVPVRLDDTPMNPKIEYDLAGIDFVDMFVFNERSISKLKNAIWGQLAMNNSL